MDKSRKNYGQKIGKKTVSYFFFLFGEENCEVKGFLVSAFSISKYEMPQFPSKLFSSFVIFLSLHTKLYTNIRYCLNIQKYLEDILRKYFQLFSGIIKIPIKN